MKKAITLLSGGLDSFVSTHIARKKYKIILALTFDYGQRAAKREIMAAGKMCRPWKIPHKVIKLQWLGEITKTALVDREVAVPIKRSHDLTTARSVWVPNRNGVFINVAASFAESSGASFIITGFNKEEAATFPDNGKKFVTAINRTLQYSTLFSPCKRGERGGLRVVSCVQNMTKKDMVRYAASNGLPLHLCWPCYKGGRGLCRRCESCVRFFRALSLWKGGG